MLMNQFTTIAYTAEATLKRDGATKVSLSDGVLDIDLGEAGVSTNPRANPETLFASACAASFRRALTDPGVAGRYDTSNAVVTADVALGSTNTVRTAVAVVLKVRIPGVAHQQAERLAELAVPSCPYASAMRAASSLSITVD